MRVILEFDEKTRWDFLVLLGKAIDEARESRDPDKRAATLMLCSLDTCLSVGAGDALISSTGEVKSARHAATRGIGE